MTKKYDLIIIGAGPGGYESALEAAGLNMDVALIEKGQLGGTCLNRGCIPTKTLLHTAELYRSIEDSADIGLEVQNASVNMTSLQKRKEDVLEQLRNGVALLMKNDHIDMYHGIGTVLDAGRVKISDADKGDPGNGPMILETKNILIATGSSPAVIPVPGADLPGVMTSDDILNSTELYDHLVIIGGGVIGMEFASLYSALGRKVTVIESMKRILPSMDKEISQNLKMILKKHNVDIHTGSVIDKIAGNADGPCFTCYYTEKETRCQIDADGVLIATGRKAFTDSLISEESSQDVRGMEMKKGCITVNSQQETSVRGIYAIGDVTGGIQLAHAATAQGRNAVHHMAGLSPAVKADLIPGCVYTSPEIASVGLSADEAKEAGIDAGTKKHLMSANGKSILSGQERGFIKVVFDRGTEQILGAQMMCARATDMISQFTAAIANQLTLNDIGSIVFPHPTFSEGISEAVR